MSGDGRCEGCGLVLAGGRAGCQTLFDDESIRAYEDIRFARHRRMIVDVYALQHPDRYCVSAKSLVAHLTGLCVAIEHPDRPDLNDAVRRWLDRPPPLVKPALPDFRGTLTIAGLRVTTDASQHADAAASWARDTWAAFDALHGIARAWLESATRVR